MASSDTISESILFDGIFFYFFKLSNYAIKSLNFTSPWVLDYFSWFKLSDLNRLRAGIKTCFGWALPSILSWLRGQLNNLNKSTLNLNILLYLIIPIMAIFSFHLSRNMDNFRKLFGFCLFYQFGVKFQPPFLNSKRCRKTLKINISHYFIIHDGVPEWRKYSCTYVQNRTP